MAHNLRKHPVIAIDGPAGSGKSTLARSLARELDLAYVNTGLMYRALTARAIDEGVDLTDEAALGESFARLGFGLSAGDPPVLSIGGVAAAELLYELSTEAVEARVSQVARHPKVRSLMREEQRRLGSSGAVMEGRDIGSVVFPDADVKIFLRAGADERAARRVAERGGQKQLAEELAERDAKDERVNPFVAPEGALTIDTTPNTPEQTLEQALEAIHEQLGSQPS